MTGSSTPASDAALPALPEPAARGLAEHLRRHEAGLCAGRARLGFKIAFNAPAIQERLGIPYSLVAGLSRSTVLEPGTRYALGGSRRVALEAEVAVRLGRAIDPADPPDSIASAIAAWAPAIEVVEFDRPLDDLEQILADGVFHRAVAFGDWVAPAPGASLKGIRARVTANGEVVCDVDAREATGEASAVLSHVARLLDRFDRTLARDDVLILGSMNPMTPARAGTPFGLELSGVGAVSLHLDP